MLFKTPNTAPFLSTLKAYYESLTMRSQRKLTRSQYVHKEASCHLIVFCHSSTLVPHEILYPHCDRSVMLLLCSSMALSCSRGTYEHKANLLASSSSCPASIGPDGQWDEDNQQTYAPGDCLPDNCGIGLVEYQPAHSMDDDRNRLVLRKRAQPVRHGAG